MAQQVLSTRAVVVVVVELQHLIAILTAVQAVQVS